MMSIMPRKDPVRRDPITGKPLPPRIPEHIIWDGTGPSPKERWNAYRKAKAKWNKDVEMFTSGVKSIYEKIKTEVKKMRVSSFKVKKEPGYLYFVDKSGYISRAPMKRGKKRKGRKQRISTQKIKREKGYLYYVDKAGYIAKVKMARGRR